MKLLACIALLVAAGPALAQQDKSVQEPQVQRSVIEDDGVRIEELRVRGVTRRILVQSKLGQPAVYEIVPADPGRDPSQGRGASKGAAGQRVWNVLKF